MPALINRRLLLGVTGGIAAYKSADLVRRLKDWGADVQVIMTPAATHFVGPLTFQAVSGHPVRLDMFDPSAEAGMSHIELARWADLILIAPASADFLARLAHGLGNDLLSTLCLASDRPIAVAPAMNRIMWQNPATRDNCRLLEQRGILLWGPGMGDQACGETGAGRMLEPLELRDHVLASFTGGGVLTDVNVLITAGPTREALDPVRYLSNRSTGRMGFAVATAAVQAGARVTLVSGPVSLPTPAGVERLDVETALQMYDAVLSRVGAAQIFIATAAVADYRPVQAAGHKIKKTADNLTLTLEPNPDILATVAALQRPPFTVGFAAETQDVVAYAQDKLRRKRLNLIAANQVGLAGSGFESEQNALHVLWEGGERVLPLADKTELARALIALVAERYHASH
jgi:phosphopantothenoylcysteine decarboxylase/phosphopantothenate--cysteine ligase